MQVKISMPPNADAIRKVFPIDGRPLLFAYYPDIYNPSGTEITPELIAHEKVHLDRQKENPELWWEFYLGKPEFRFHEELVAHQAEYAYVKHNYNRQRRRAMLSMISERLASSLYGGLTTKRKAKELILHGS